MTRRPPTVAIIGPDGAGKTSVARQLPDLLPVPARYLYMGWNYGASNVLLPTSRLVRRRGPKGADGRRTMRGVASRVAAGIKLANLVAEAWYRQIVANRWSRAGYLVIFDRHFVADFPDSKGRQAGSPLRRVRHAILRHAVPVPAILIYLDARPETLLRRKGEGTVESLERQRAAYRTLIARHRRAAQVSAEAGLVDVSSRVAAKVMELMEADGG